MHVLTCTHAHMNMYLCTRNRHIHKRENMGQKKELGCVCRGEGVSGGCWARDLFMIVVEATGLRLAHLNTGRTVLWVGEDGDLPGLEPEMPEDAGYFSMEVAVGRVRQVSRENGKLI